MIRRLALAALLLLGGCNMVTGPASEFGKADGGGLTLKSGLWSVTKCEAPEPCEPPHFSVKITGTVLELVQSPSPLGTPGRAMNFAFAAGEPMLMEFSPREVPPGEQSGVLFVAIEVTERDAAGRAIELRASPIECGPPPGPDAWNYGLFGEKGMTTDRPYAGLTMQGETCTGKGLEAVRHAAIESRTNPTNGTLTIRWTRNAP